LSLGGLPRRFGFSSLIGAEGASASLPGQVRLPDQTHVALDLRMAKLSGGG
jgi:hypothetical protein